MENKYFTPDIEDIRVGYECEELWSTGEWIKGTLDSQDFWIIPDEIKAKGIRVPYLTKEQIEAEGWILDKTCQYGYYIKDKIWLDFSEQSHEIEIHSIPSPYDENCRYNGECKDINTFRYICKLLGI